MKRGQQLIKHYTFDSRLSPEQVRARLLPDGGFYLAKTGGLCWLLLTKLAPALNRRQQRETIAFMEENLLRESAAPGKENLK